MRLIDAERLKIVMIETLEKIKQNPKMDNQEAHILAAFHTVGVMVDDAPTIEAEPVVRCKDCRWGRETCGNIECFIDINAPTEYHGYNWYCPNGEKKGIEIKLGGEKCYATVTANTVDAVPVVRCWECKHSHPWYADRRTCVMWSETGTSVFNDGFCSYGERKDDE